MSEWRSATVAELEKEHVLLVQDGNHGNDRPLNHEFTPVGTPFIRAADIREGRALISEASRINESALARIRKGHGRAGDTLFSHKGTVGKIAYVPEGTEPFVCSPQTTFWRSTDHGVLHPRFLAFILESPGVVSQVDSMKGQTDMAPYVSLTQQRQLRVAFPPLNEQAEICDVLGALDDKTAANSRILNRADQFIAAQFDRAMIEGTKSSPLLAELRIEFGEPFGGQFFSAPGSGRPLIRIRDLKSFDSQVWTAESRGRETVIDAGDVLVGMDAEFRATTWLGDRGVLNQRVLRASHERYGNALVREVLRLPLSEIENEKSATTVIHLNKSDLARKPVVMPVETALLEFERLAEPLYDARVALAKENRTLAATRHALLPQLMSGGLRVRDAEAIAADAGA